MELDSSSAVATRSITTRRPQFDFGERLERRHFVQGDLLTSHFVALMSAIIPEGERFVVDAVKRYRAEIDDPQLRKQANAFIGQEMVHQREHERLNETLRAMGYPTRFVHHTGMLLNRIGQLLPRRTQLAVTAAIEHWTAVLAGHALGADRPSAEPIDEIQAFIDWHLIEEIEHKAVAFDVMAAAGTTERQRVAAMRLLLLLVGPGLAVGLVVSLAKDPAAWNPANVIRSLRWARQRPALAQGSFAADIRSWNTPGFHPDQRDDAALLERWRTEAFGPGSIVERRSRRGAA